MTFSCNQLRIEEQNYFAGIFHGREPALARTRLKCNFKKRNLQNNVTPFFNFTAAPLLSLNFVDAAA